MDKIKRGLKKVLFSYRTLPEKKQYIEFFTALLTVPVLLTVITLNLNNLKGSDETKGETPTERTVYVTVPPTEDEDSDTTPTPTVEACEESVGPVSIAYPEENEIITDNPVMIDIDYDDSEHCPVVWSYRLNGGRFSEYGSNNIALYNPPQGTVRLELRVRSVVSNDEELIRRTFVYEGNSTSTNEEDASSSAN